MLLLLLLLVSCPLRAPRAVLSDTNRMCFAIVMRHSSPVSQSFFPSLTSWLRRSRYLRSTTSHQQPLHGDAQWLCRGRSCMALAAGLSVQDRLHLRIGENLPWKAPPPTPPTSLLATGSNDLPAGSAVPVAL